MTDIVTLTNLTKTYNGIPALRDVTMSIPSGKMEKKHYQKFPQVLPLVCMVS